MSQANGEKARAAIARRNKVKRRVKDRASLARLRSEQKEAAAEPAKKSD